jgi:DNA-directed RNA polymerase specialized sigma24 family protein
MRLPEEQKIAITLHIMEGLSYEETAEIMDTGTGTAQSRVYYGL